MSHDHGQPGLGLRHGQDPRVDRHLAAGQAPGVHGLRVVDEDRLPLEFAHDLRIEVTRGFDQSRGDALDHLVVGPGVDHHGGLPHLRVRVDAELRVLLDGEQVEVAQGVAAGREADQGDSEPDLADVPPAPGTRPAIECRAIGRTGAPDSPTSPRNRHDSWLLALRLDPFRTHGLPLRAGVRRPAARGSGPHYDLHRDPERAANPSPLRVPRGAVVTRHPLLLVILDGWGQREESDANAVAACAPYFHELTTRYPTALLTAHGRDVGLPPGVMGNSEVGHMNLGAGRRVYQDVSRIDASIESGEFFENPALVGLMDRVRRDGGRLHLFGLVSNGGVHASDLHLRSLLTLAARRGLDAGKVLVHAITDGRDTPPRSGAGFLEALERDIAEAGVGRIASVVGRYWAMDRDERWDRTERAYALLMFGGGAVARTAAEAIQRSYETDVSDEFVEPTVVGAQGSSRIEAGDGLLCFNFRSDRMRQICRALGLAEFEAFDRGTEVRPEIVTMTRYREDFPFAIAFAPVELPNTFPELVSRAGLTQKRIAETEKYAHVTFFFSGGKEQPLPGEERILLPSPKVATYDLQPEMS
ncbi:MAG: 2,3-bisphosphoglycerate-independent phosphoglycerate mutase, partial [Planctomycetota bacterium]